MQRDRVAVRQFEMVPVDEASKSDAEGKPDQSVDRWYWIDNDNYEVKPIRVTLVPEAIKVFGVSTSR